MRATHYKPRESSQRAAQYVEYGAPNTGFSRSTYYRVRMIREYSPRAFKKILNGEEGILAVMDRLGVIDLNAGKAGLTEAAKRRRLETKRKMMRRKWNADLAIRRLENALQRELAMHHRYEGSDEDYLEIGNWLTRRGKQWNSIRSGESCGYKIAEGGRTHGNGTE